VGGLMNECVSIAQPSCTMDVMWVRRLYCIEFDRPSLQAEPRGWQRRWPPVPWA